MRVWLYNRIKNLAGLHADFKAEGKIISSGSADRPEAPFLVVTMGVEQPPVDMPPEMRTQSIPFTVWVHDTPGSMIKIDDGALALKIGLPTFDAQMVGGLSLYELRWTDTGEDTYDDHFGTNCRPVRFAAMTRR